MSNMSYCRFENTANDLRDCVDNADSEVSQEEHRARKRIAIYCAEFLNTIGMDVDKDEAEKLAEGLACEDER